MDLSTNSPFSVMISSTMLNLHDERLAIADILKDAGFKPLNAEDRPFDYNLPIKKLSIDMARHCTLYILIIHTRYGSHLDDDPLSITHREFVTARDADQYKIYTFISDAAIRIAASPTTENKELADFISEVIDKSKGVTWDNYTDLNDLYMIVKKRVTNWKEQNEAALRAYLANLRNELATFYDPVLGMEISNIDTILLKLRTLEESTTHTEDENGHQRIKGNTQLKSDDREKRSSHLSHHVNTKSIIETPPTTIGTIKDFLKSHERLIIYGDVGSGKSTLLRRIAFDTSHASSSERVKLPILIRATDLGRTSHQFPTGSLATIVAQVKENENHLDTLKPTIRATITQAIARGDALLLVDGFDEATAGEQESVINLLNKIGANQAVLASRPSTRIVLPGWQMCDVQILDTTQRFELVSRVFQALKLNNISSNPQMLLDAIDTRDDLTNWSGNPLLLTLIAAQFLNMQRLPDSRARAYQIAIEYLQRQRQMRAADRLSHEDVTSLLHILALRMTEKNRRITTSKEVAFTYLRNELSTQFPDDFENVARELLFRSGVLQDLGDKSLDDSRWEFVHQSFREYLAAAALAEQPKLIRQISIHRFCLSANWEQVFMLLTNIFDARQQQTEADQVILALVESDRQRVKVLRRPDPTHTALRVATRCYLGRLKAFQSRSLHRTLAKRWLPIWKSDFHNNLMISEQERYASWLVKYFQIHTFDDYLIYDFELAAPYASECIEILMPILNHKWKQHSAIFIVVTMALLLISLFTLYFTTQITLGFFPHSATAAIIRQITPTAVFALILGIIGCRFLSWPLRHRRTRAIMLAHAVRNLGPAAHSALPAIIPLLTDSKMFIRHNATSAIESISPPATNMLYKPTQNENNGDFDVYQGIEKAITGITPDKVKFVDKSTYLSSISETVKPTIVADPLLFQRKVDRTITSSSIAEFGINSLYDLNSYLSNNDPYIRMLGVQMISVLKFTAQATIPILVPLLSDSDFDVRSKVIQVITEVDTNGDSLPLLFKLLDSNKYETHEAAARAIIAFGPVAVSALPTLKRMLFNKDHHIRVIAAETIAAIGPAAKSALPILIRKLGRPSSRNFRTREAVAIAIAALGAEASSALPALIPHLHDRVPNIRQIASQIITSTEIEVTPSEIRKITRRFSQPELGWVIKVITLIHFILDWPVLILILLAQCTYLWPLVFSFFSKISPISWFFGLTSWWQTLLIFFIYAFNFVVLSYLYGGFSQARYLLRTYLHPPLESIIRRYISDTTKGEITQNNE